MENKKISLTYVKENFFTLLTVLVGIIAIPLKELGLVSSNLLESLTLGIVTLLATSQLVDNSRKLDQISENIDRRYDHIVSSLGGVSVLRIPESEHGLRYMAKCVREAKIQIDLASLTPSFSRDKAASLEWENAIEDLLLGNRVRFRYVFNREPARLTRVQKHIQNPKIKKFYAGFIDKDPSLPFPGILIIDKKEVITIYPSPFDEPDNWISIKHPDVVDVYENYFQYLWKEAIRISAKENEIYKLTEISIIRKNN